MQHLDLSQENLEALEIECFSQSPRPWDKQEAAAVPLWKKWITGVLGVLLRIVGNKEALDFFEAKAHELIAEARKRLEEKAPVPPGGAA